MCKTECPECSGERSRQRPAPARLGDPGFGQGVELDGIHGRALSRCKADRSIGAPETLQGVVRALPPDAVPFERVAGFVDRAARLRRALLLAVLTGWATDVVHHVIFTNPQVRTADAAVALFAIKALRIAYPTRTICRDAVKPVTCVGADVPLRTARAIAAGVLSTAFAAAHDRCQGAIGATAFAFDAVLNIGAAAIVS